MKVLLNHHIPFALSHGGMQVQIEQTQTALQEAGVTVEPLRWWDDTQTGDVLHHFTRIPRNLLTLAQRKGMKVVMTDLLTEQGSRSRLFLGLQKFITRGTPLLLPKVMTAYFGWDSYLLADACVALTPWEAYLIRYIFGPPAKKVHIIPNGVEEVFLEGSPVQRGKWLVCTATITERKEVLKLAVAALGARVPVWIIGKPYSESDPYFQQFLALAKGNPETIRYEGAISDRNRLAQIYREARAFVLLSKWESLSLSALEAAACKCPLLLSELPWAKSHFGTTASYCPVNGSIARTSVCLRSFYDSAPVLAPPPKPASWAEIGARLKELYEQLLRNGPALAQIP
jgi:glycosyltransferase involved in cell wall biosynthesis